MITEAETLERLQQLGLSKYAARVYVQLLQLGLTNAGPVIRACRLHRQFVYQALDELCAARLASCVIRNNRKHFEAAPPQMLLLKAKEQETLAQEILPGLAALQCAPENRVQVQTLFGRKSLYDNLEEVLLSAAQSDRLLRIIGGAPDRLVYEMLGGNYARYVRLLAENKVRKHLIAPERGSEEFKRKFALEKGAVLKTLAHGLSSPTYTRITLEMVSIEIYTPEPIILQIRNKAVAQGYLEHFELLWREGRLFKVTKGPDQKT